MRIAIAGFALESVTFLPETTDIADFERTAKRGPELVDSLGGTESAVGGLIDACRAAGAEPVGLVYVNAGVGGAASDEAFDKYVGEIVERIEAERDRVDGLMLFLHGALATPKRRRADADVLAAVRAVVGPDFPIGLALDYHGNIGPAVVDRVTVLAGYRESPHIDMRETGRRAGSMLMRAIGGEVEPHMALARPGVALPSVFSATSLEPLVRLVERARTLPERVPGVLDASLFGGFAYADVPDMGMAVTVVADDADVAAREAASLAAEVRDLRADLFPMSLILDVEAGIDRAFEVRAKSDRPVCILEHADRMNDSTYTLRALLARGEGRSYAPFMFDPQAAAQAAAAGAGATIDIEFCGRTSDRAGGPASGRARVLWAGEKRIRVTGPLYTGVEMDLGLCATLDFGSVVVSLISVQWSAIDMDCFVPFGVSPDMFDIIVLRSKTHFRTVYEPLCAEIVIVDTPDWGPADIALLPYRQVEGKPYPLDRA